MTQKDKVNEWLGTLEIKGRTIDIGGGKRTVKARLQSFEGEYVVLDQKTYKGLEMKADIFHDFNTPIKSDNFDVAFMIFVFKNLWNIPQAFKNVYKLLKKGGVFYFNASFKSPIDTEGEDYFRITEMGIRKILKETGFEVIYANRYNLSEEADFCLVKAKK